MADQSWADARGAHPKQLFYGELSDKKRSHGGQGKRFKDTVKVSLKALEIDSASWEHVAVERSSGCSLITKRAVVTEERRRAGTKERTARGAQRDEGATSTPITAASHVCPTCGSHVRARIDLSCHNRTQR